MLSSNDSTLRGRQELDDGPVGSQTPRPGNLSAQALPVQSFVKKLKARLAKTGPSGKSMIYTIHRRLIVADVGRHQILFVQPGLEEQKLVLPRIV